MAPPSHPGSVRGLSHAAAARRCVRIAGGGAFAVPPLARARAIKPASLFRDVVDRSRGANPLAVSSRLGDRRSPRSAVGARDRAVAAVRGGVPRRHRRGLLILRLVAGGLRWVIARLPRAGNTNLRLALANLVRARRGDGGRRDGARAGTDAASRPWTLLGRTIGAQVRDELPESAPSFFFVDIQPDQAEGARSHRIARCVGTGTIAARR